MKKDIVKLLAICMFISCSSQAKQVNDNIEVYNAFGNDHKIIIHGRMVKKEKVEKVSVEDSSFTNILNTIDFFHSDEIKDKKVFLTVGKERFETISDDEGYFDFNVTTLKKLILGYEDVNLEIENTPFIHHAKATIISRLKRIGIISDIDDTIIVSDVTKKSKLLFNIFWKNYKQREVIPTMAKRFQDILAKNPPYNPSRLFFLSGSPEQLFTPIENFLAYNHFPKHVIILKHIHGTHKDPLFDQFVYKKQKIENLIALYPNMRWIMFGDSSEKDREVYKFIKNKYPNKVKSYYIRDVTNGKIKVFE